MESPATGPPAGPVSYPNPKIKVHYVGTVAVLSHLPVGMNDQG
jgi:hypothetical protein